MFIFHKKGLKLNGKNPMLLTGYGGFNISMTPAFVEKHFYLARSWWRLCGGKFAGRSGVRRGLAPCRNVG